MEPSERERMVAHALHTCATHYMPAKFHHRVDMNDCFHQAATIIRVIEEHMFLEADNCAIPVSKIVRIDFENLEEGVVQVVTTDGEIFTSTGFEAFRIAMDTSRNLEGKRLKWVKHAWWFHNIVGHPLMQILAWLGFKRAAMVVHDRTSPRPVDFR